MILTNYSQNIKSFDSMSKFLGFDWIYTYFLLYLGNLEKALSAEKLATGIVKYIFKEVNIRENTSSGDDIIVY